LRTTRREAAVAIVEGLVLGDGRADGEEAVEPVEPPQPAVAVATKRHATNAATTVRPRRYIRLPLCAVGTSKTSAIVRSGPVAARCTEAESRLR
jgi:hypothetical protein